MEEDMSQFPLLVGILEGKNRYDCPFLLFHFMWGFFYTSSALILWYLKYSLGDPTHSSQGLHILRKLCGTEGGFGWLIRIGDEGVLFTKGNYVILESC